MCILQKITKCDNTHVRSDRVLIILQIKQMKDDHPRIVPHCRSAFDSSVSAFILDQTSVTLSFILFWYLRLWILHDGIFFSEKINYSVMLGEMDMSDQKAGRKSKNMKHQLNVDSLTRESENLFVPDKIIKFWSLGKDKNNC